MDSVDGVKVMAEVVVGQLLQSVKLSVAGGSACEIGGDGRVLGVNHRASWWEDHAHHLCAELLRSQTELRHLMLLVVTLWLDMGELAIFGNPYPTSAKAQPWQTLKAKFSPSKKWPHT